MKGDLSPSPASPKSPTLAAAIVLSLGSILMPQPATPQARLAAVPTAGPPPLVVVFTGTGSGESEGVMMLDFGDGHVDDTIPTVRNFSRTHTYAVAGTYIAVLKSAPFAREPLNFTIMTSIEIVVR